MIYKVKIHDIYYKVKIYANTLLDSKPKIKGSIDSILAEVNDRINK